MNVAMAQGERRGRAAQRPTHLHRATWSAAAADFTRVFPNEDACLEFVKELRWPGGITRCETCGVERKHHRVSGRKAYACNRCGAHVYPLQGTLFARSATPLQKWFYAMCVVAGAGRNVTARRIQRETSVTYKTAWRILRQLRAAIARCDCHAQLLAHVTSAGTQVDGRVESASPLAIRSTEQSLNAPCLEGIFFILSFFPVHLRMCRDV